MFSLLAHISPSWYFFWALAFFRYVRLIVNVVVYFFCYKPVPIPPSPTYTSKDVTVIIPTLAEDADQLLATITSAMRLEPKEILVVTVEKLQSRIDNVIQVKVQDAAKPLIKVLNTDKANKRVQMVKALPHVSTRFTLLLDDDVVLPPRFMEWTLAPFEDQTVGGVGTNQRLRRESRMNMWNFLGAIYLERRNFDCTACNWIDGGLPCLSGRAVMYRSTILQDIKFQTGFENEDWSFFGLFTAHRLKADDDNFITRWLFSHGWKIKMQNHRACEVETTLIPNHNYLRQCVRWVRSNWRSNYTSLFTEANVWGLCGWSTYAVFQTTFTQWVVLIDPLLCWSLYEATKSWDAASAQRAYGLFAAFWLWSRLVKFMQYFARNFGDLKFIPLLIAFGYFHNSIKLYGLLTVNKTTWGSRPDADSDDGERLQRVDQNTTAPMTTASEKWPHDHKGEEPKLRSTSTGPPSIPVHAQSRATEPMHAMAPIIACA